MSLALATLAAVLSGPDPVPHLAAVDTCDRGAMQAMSKAEPHRRSQWAAAIYAEQQAIARERGDLLARQAVAIPPGEASEVNLALAMLDRRQRRLDEARNVEASWRTLVEELRLDFLANCSRSRRSGGDE